MSTSAINVGTVETEYRVKDLGKESIDKIVLDIGRLEKISKALTSALKVENDKVAASYSKLAASLDPVVAANQKHAQGLATLDSALKKGIITQDQYASSVAKLNAQLSAPGDRAKALADTKAREAATKAATIAAKESARAQQLAAKEEAKARDISAKASALAAKETAKLESSYKKLSASLDPVTAKEQKYKNAVDVLDAALKKGIITQDQYNKELEKANKKFQEVAFSSAKFAKTMQDQGAKLSSVGKTITASVTLPIVGLGVASLKTATDLNKTLANISSLLTNIPAGQELDSTLSGMKENIRSLAIEVGKSTDDISEGLYEVISSLGYTDDSFDQVAISAKAAKAGLATTQEAFNFLSATTKAYGDTSEEAFKKVADLGFQAVNVGQTTFPQLAASIGGVAPIAKLAGISLEELFAVIATATGVTGNTSEVVNQIAAATNALLSPSAKMQDLYKAIGISSGEALIAQYGFAGALQVVAKSAEKSNVPLLDLLGRKEALILAATLAGSQEKTFAKNLDTMGEAAGANGKIVEEAFKRQTKGINEAGFAWEQFKVKADIALQRLGDSLLPVIMRAGKSLEPLLITVERLSESFSKLPQSAQTSIIVLAGIAAAVGPSLIVLGSLITAFGNVVAIYPSVVVAVKAVGAAFLTLPVAIVAASVSVGIAANNMLNKWKQSMDEVTQIMTNFQSRRMDYQTLVNKYKEGFERGFLNVDTRQASAQMKQDILNDIKNLENKLQEIQKQAAGASSEVRSLYKDKESAIAGEIKTQKTRLEFLGKLFEKSKDLKTVFPLKAEDFAIPVPEVETPTAFTILGEDADKLKSKLGNLKVVQQEQAETLRHLRELADLAAKGPGLDLGKRLTEERRINDEHEYRVDLLQQQQTFGKELGKQIADANRKLKELGRDVRIKLQIALDIEEINLDNVFKAAISDLEIDKIKEYLQIQKENEEAFGSVAKAAEEWLEGYAEQWRESFKSIEDVAAENVAAIEAAVRDGLLTVAEGERALAQIRMDLMSEQMGQWNTLFSFLGDKFGGVIQQISQALDNIKAAYDTGKSLDASGFGGSMSGSWGAAFATIQIMYEIYKAVDAKIEERKAKTWGDVTSLRVVNGQMSSPSYFDENGRTISSALRNALEEIVNSLGGVLDNLPEIVIRSRKDAKEFSAYVAGIWVGTFKDAESALAQAISSALQMADFAFISKEFAQVLERSIGATMDELEQNLNTARTVRGARLGSVGESYLDISDRMRAESEAAKRLGLSISDLISARQKEQQTLVDQTLGINTATAQRLRDLRSLDAGMREAAGGTRAYLERQIDRINAEILRLAAVPPRRQEGGPAAGGGSPGPSGGGAGGGGGSGGRGIANSSFDETIDALHRELLGFLNQLEEIPEALSEVQLRMGVFDTLYSYVEGQAKYAEEAYKYAVMKVDAEFKALKLELEMLGMWEEFAEMFNDAYNAQIQLIGRDRGGRRGGGGTDTTSGVRDFIKDREFDIASRSMSETERQIAELNREYDKQAESLGRNSPLLAQLNNLRAREIELIRQQQIESTLQGFREFMGLISPFESVRDTAADLIEQIEDSPFGDARKARMIGRVLAEVERQLDRMSQEMAAGVFGDLISNMEKYGAEESLMAEARMQLAILEHTMTLINLRERIEALKLEGRVSNEIITTMEKGLSFLEGIDPTRLLGPSSVPAGPDYEDGTWQWTGAGWVKKAPGTDTSAIDAARDLLKQYQDDALDSLTRELNKINADFTTISSALGNTAEVLAAKNAAIARAIDDFLEPVRNFRNEMDFSETSTLNVEDQFKTVQEQFRELAEGATLQDRDALLALAEKYLNLADEFTGGEAYRFIDSEIKGVLDKFLALGPGSTTLGSTTNPMSISAPTVQSAIENGNIAIVSELRTHGGLLIGVNNRLRGVESQLTNNLNVRNIA